MKLHGIFTLLVFIFISHNVFSVPAYPFLIKKMQPNGEEITVRMKGDENIKWMESEDGYSLLYDKDKYIVYAEKDRNGDMVPSTVRAKDRAFHMQQEIDFLKKIPKKLQYSNRQKAIFRQLSRVKEKNRLKADKLPKAATGKAKAICALIEFQDKSFHYKQEDFDLLINQLGYSKGEQKGSVRDYYLENSYGQLDLVVSVVGPYKAKNNYSYYGENDSDGYDKRPHELAKEAADFAFNESFIQPSDYDNDGDGFIDTFHFIFAGHGEESGADSDYIWAHKSIFLSPLHYGDKKLEDYSCSPELRNSFGNEMTYIGVICHELCHVFGAPDFYDADADFSGGEYLGTGSWDLMASGSWNNKGTKPAHINMYQKIQFGWVKPIILSSPIHISGMLNSAENPVAYIIESHIQGEYYVLENRQKVKFDSGIPGSGLLIYHVSITEGQIRDNTVNTGHPQGVYPIAAHSKYQVPSSIPASYGTINSSFTPYPSYSIYTNTEFSDTSTPSSILWNGDGLGKPIFNIKQEKELISFDFMEKGPPTAIEKVNASFIRFYPTLLTSGEKLNVNREENVHGEMKMIVYSLSGQVVLYKVIKERESQHPINLPSGAYLLTIIYNQNKITERLIVK